MHDVERSSTTTCDRPERGLRCHGHALPTPVTTLVNSHAAAFFSFTTILQPLLARVTEVYRQLSVYLSAMSLYFHPSIPPSFRSAPSVCRPLLGTNLQRRAQLQFLMIKPGSAYRLNIQALFYRNGLTHAVCMLFRAPILAHPRIACALQFLDYGHCLKITEARGACSALDCLIVLVLEPVDARIPSSRTQP